MDLWTKLAIAAVIAFLQERKYLDKARPAMVKVYRSISAAYENDAAFQTATKDLRE